MSVEPRPQSDVVLQSEQTQIDILSVVFVN